MLPLFSPLRVLLVDDNPLNLKILKRTLHTHFNHLINVENIATASGGREAIDKIANSDCLHSSYDIIFLDIDMPDMSGIEVTQRIRNEMNNVSTTIVAVTTSDSEEQRLRYIEVGIDGCCKKPVMVSALSEVVSQALQSRKSMSRDSSLATPSENTEEIFKEGIIDVSLMGAVQALTLSPLEEPVVVVPAVLT